MRSGVRLCLRTCTSTRSPLPRWTEKRRTEHVKPSSVTISHRRPLPPRIIKPSPSFRWSSPHPRALMNLTCMLHLITISTTIHSGQGRRIHPFPRLSLRLIRPRLQRRGTCRRRLPRRAPYPQHPLRTRARPACSFILLRLRTLQFIPIIGLQDAAFDDPSPLRYHIIIRPVTHPSHHAHSCTCSVFMIHEPHFFFYRTHYIAHSHLAFQSTHLNHNIINSQALGHDFLIIHLSSNVVVSVAYYTRTSHSHTHAFIWYKLFFLPYSITLACLYNYHQNRQCHRLGRPAPPSSLIILLHELSRPVHDCPRALPYAGLVCVALS